MMKYTEKDYREARMVAIHVHGNQMYGAFPYVKHLDDVVDVLERFGFSDEYKIGGYFHDTGEDTSLAYTKLVKRWGLDVAEMVYCVTDELGRTRKEKKEKTLPKTASNPKAIILKLADRIANVEMGGKIGMYSKEYEEFKKALYLRGTDAEPMWEHLDGLLKLETVKI
jgi:(p)ppGpp synthase/HD superfamily hydrolase